MKKVRVNIVGGKEKAFKRIKEVYKGELGEIKGFCDEARPLLEKYFEGCQFLPRPGDLIFIDIKDTYGAVLTLAADADTGITGVSFMIDSGSISLSLNVEDFE